MVSILCLSTGIKKVIHQGIETLAYYSISPTGKFMVYYDYTERDYFTYEIGNGIKRKLSNGTINWLSTDNDLPQALPVSRQLVWATDESFLIINDNYDLWKIDPNAIFAPTNITQYYGVKSHIKFRVFNSMRSLNLRENAFFRVSAFNELTKQNGFYLISTKLPSKPFQLTMSSVLFDWDANSFEPIKAKDTELYIVRQMTAKLAPNYFVTSDFVSFSPFTKNAPQLKFNWISDTLIHWSLHRRVQSAVVYKPQNYNASKKYPVIVYLYERFSDRLNEFIAPDVCDGPINIPLFVSNGYIVVVPDIYYEIGKPGLSALNTVKSMIKYLSKFSWLDKAHIGIQGHSFGGFEVNYIVSQTHLFTAAISASGVSDFISGYGALRGSNGSSRQWIYELSQSRIGAPMSVRPDLYINNSPIFNVRNVNTPLFLMSNKKDKQVPYEQGIEWFTSLRRNGKKCWLIQYENGGHGVSSYDALDFTIRMQQFFDHYLKGKPAPIWMTRGIPAKLKGIQTGLEHDTVIETPGESPLIERTKGKQ